MTDRRTVLGIFAAAVALPNLRLAISPASAAQPVVFTGRLKGVAVGGYDAVAYFTDKKPVKGNPTITADYNGATWWFASEANRTLFLSDPARYAPQYGGYCAWAVSRGYTADGDPLAWTVADGKLYLNYNKAVRFGWERDIPGNVKRGDANWPKVLEK